MNDLPLYTLQSNAFVYFISGDAYRYTIQPVFKNLKSKFQCHVRLKKPVVLYELFFNVKVPGPHGTEIETPKVRKIVYAQEFDDHSTGSYQADYINVQHNTGLKVEDEFILVGEDNPSSVRPNFTVFPMKRPEDFRQRKVVVHEIVPNNIFVASTQFEKPFAYSSSSWVRDSDCDKDISKFKYEQKHYRSEEPQLVDSIIQTVDAPYLYLLKKKENSPYMRFQVPG